MQWRLSQCLVSGFSEKRVSHPHHEAGDVRLEDPPSALHPCGVAAEGLHQRHARAEQQAQQRRRRLRPRQTLPAGGPAGKRIANGAAAPPQRPVSLCGAEFRCFSIWIAVIAEADSWPHPACARAAFRRRCVHKQIIAYWFNALMHQGLST